MKRLVLLLAVVCAVARPAFSQGEPATKSEVEELKGALNGLSESAAEYRGYVDALRKIKITGYMQPQFRYTDNLPDARVSDQNVPGTFSGGAFGANAKNLFQVRRGRIKLDYDNTLTHFVIQIDAIQTGFTTKDAYLSLIDPWTRSFGFQAGIFDRPFGYEISYSSSNRETPERSRMFQTLFPGERELGMKVFYAPPMGPLSFLRADLGVFNGSGPTANEYDNYKDIIGHLAAAMPFNEANAELDLGVSGYFGKVRNNTKYLYKEGTLPTGLSGFTVDSSAANQSNGVTRRYLGVDAQFYYDLPVLGGMILRGEFITGKQPGQAKDNRSQSAQPAGGLYARDFNGWYVYYVQNIGPRDQVVVKYDVFDPNTKVAAEDFTNLNTSGALGLTNADIKYSTLGLGLVHYWDDNIKFVFYWESVANEKLSNVTTGSLLAYASDVPDNVFTFRVQYRF